MGKINLAFIYGSYKVFFLNIGFSSPTIVIYLPGINGSFLPNFMFVVVGNFNMLIIIINFLFELHVLCISVVVDFENTEVVWLLSSVSVICLWLANIGYIGFAKDIQLGSVEGKRCQGQRTMSWFDGMNLDWNKGRYLKIKWWDKAASQTLRLNS